MTVDESNQRDERIDRRDANTPRVQYEALVEVGAGSTGGFEAESVDVSVDGIRLRTAYLPQPGEALVCRFNGVGGEIVAEGQVSWCRQEDRGGEFGVRFTNLDAYGAQLLEAICRPEEPDPIAFDGAPPGSRVRMHIEGLGAPMRARVRDAARGEVLIGSNLEFLRVGRDVQLEELDGGTKRTAQIEHVAVDIDPESRVPQLVVALRYERAVVEGGEEQLNTPVHHSQGGAHYAPLPQGGRPPMRADGTPEPAVIDAEHDSSTHGEVYAAPPIYQRHVDAYAPGSMPAPYTAGPEPHSAASPPSRSSDAPVVDAEAAPRVNRGANDGDEHTSVGFGDRLRDVVSRIGPPLASMGHGAKGAMSAVLRTVREKRGASVSKAAERSKVNGPKRTTAPPPSGALRSDGKRLFREQIAEASPPRSLEGGTAPNRKRAVFGAVLGIMSVVAIYAVADHLSGQDSDGASAVAAVDGQAPTPQLAAPAAAGQAGPVGIGQGVTVLPGGTPPGAGAPVATANVPLFGATPLSTTEAVPPPPGEATLREAGRAGALPAQPKAEEATKLRRDWGVGAVEDPNVIRLKMDGKISGVAGAEGATGFTVVIPGRKSISSAAGLARKDRRIDSVNVVNYPDRAEVTFHFKGEIPPFVVKARGKRLIVELGQAKKRKKKKAKKRKKRKKSKKSKSRAKKKKTKKKRRRKKS